MNTPRERVAVFPGSFDPLTNGHVDIILRGARLFDRIIVAILRNAEKHPLFTLEERVAMAREVFREYPNVEVESFDGLLVDYAAAKQASVDRPRPAGGVGLRVRAADGAHEPAARPRHRDGVHDAGRAVHLREFAADQGSVRPGRPGDRPGARRSSRQRLREKRPESRL